ncbi:hypothetical protein FB446DRAFT_794028 [Lentinula raphanica]|nr:hypothetical protein FB446DRAFT_794028 [Lentinula raphanica]
MPGETQSAFKIFDVSRLWGGVSGDFRARNIFPDDETTRDQNGLKLQREVKKLQKQLEKQQEELDASNRREKKLQRHRLQYEEDYYTEKGREAPESENEESDDSLAQRHLPSQHAQSDDSFRSPTPTRKSFPTSVRVVKVVTASPPRTVQKSTSRAAISVLNAQQPSELAPRSSSSPAPLSGTCSTPRSPRSPMSPMLPTTPTTADVGNSKIPADPLEEQEHCESRCLQLREGQQGDRLSHYAGKSKLLIRKALKKYEGVVMAFDMQPTADANTREEWANLIWSELMSEIDEGELPFKLSDEVIKLMGQRETRIRCAAWDRLKPIVESMYAFKHGSSVDNKKKNIELYNLLTTNFGFYFKNPEERTGYMRTPIIDEGISRVLFYNKKAYGIVMEDIFNPIPVKFIAFMYTLIENYINCWSTGLYGAQELDVDVLGVMYETHVHRLQEWDAINPEKVGKLLKHWYRVGRRYAGVAHSHVGEKVQGLTPGEHNQVAAELENMDIPDSEDDDLGSAEDVLNIPATQDSSLQAVSAEGIDLSYMNLEYCVSKSP